MDYREYERDMYRRDGYPEGWGRERRSIDYDPHGRVIERYRVRRDFEGFGGRPEPDRWRDRPVEGWHGGHGGHSGTEGGWRGWVGGEGFAPRGHEAEYYGRRDETWGRGFDE